MKYRILACLFGFAFVIAAASAWAETDNGDIVSVEAQAVKLLGQEKYEAVCSLLDQNYPADSADATVLFLRARCRLGLKDYATAVAQYERILKIMPDSQTAKNELEAARKLTKPGSKNWFALTEVGVIYDSNINAGPQNDLIIIVDTPVALGLGPTARGGYMASGLLGYLHTLSPSAILLTKISAERTDYFNDSDNQTDYFSIASGPSFFWGGTRLSVLPGMSFETYGGRAYNSSMLLNTTLTQKISKDTTIGFRANIAANNYRASDDRNGMVLSFTPTLDHKFSTGTSASLGLISRFENTNTSDTSNDTYGFRASLEQNIAPILKANLGYQNTKRTYDGADLFFGPNRREDRLNYTSLGLTWDVSQYIGANTSLTLKYQTISNKSTISLNSFERETTIFSISRSW